MHQWKQQSSKTIPSNLILMLLEFKAYPPTLSAFASLVFVDALICVLRVLSQTTTNKSSFFETLQLCLSVSTFSYIIFQTLTE
jgi:hypothetical protein